MQTAQSVRRIRVMLLTVLVVVLGLIAGCGDLAQLFPGSQQSQDLFVADTNNNRVLVYKQPFTNAQAATTVLGAPDFTTTTGGATATTLTSPNAAVADSSGNIYVVDNGNCRVLRYPAPLANGEAATVAFGQTDPGTVSCNPGGNPPATNSNLLGPGGAAFDGSGNLWVADSGYNRILRYSPPFTSGMAASLVLGQPDFTSTGCSATNTGLCKPVGVAFDASGNLWAADAGDNRVVKFSAPFSNGQAATVVLGQPDFTTTTSGTSVSVLSTPNAIAVDASGNVFVADAGNNRVMVFKAPLSNGMNAAAALGQVDFNSASANQGGSAGAATLASPSGVLVTSQGQLVVGDSGNNRTLIFTSPFSTGMSASTVLGQPDFTSSSSNQGGSASATTQSNPFGAGPSFIALAVLALLIGGWYLMQRRRQRVAG